MPRFIETKLKAEYGPNSAVPYKVMNALGMMHGNKETPKGKAMEAKHARAMHPAMTARAAAVKSAHAHLAKTQPGFLGMHPQKRIAMTQAHVKKTMK